METMAFLGCSRGLGRAVCLAMNERGEQEFSLLASRNVEQLALLGNQLNHSHKIIKADFATTQQLPTILNEIAEHKIARVFYFAGGGPYGIFSKKQWKDHLWSLQVGFLTPSELLFHLLSGSEYSHVQQIVFIGSLIADDKGDPQAASYAAGKHGLKGLIDSIHQEGCAKDVRLFRPGYMDTALLPPNATPRKNSDSLLNTQHAAQVFANWVLDPGAEKVLNVEI